jgi:hypothetical protein
MIEMRAVIRRFRSLHDRVRVQLPQVSGGGAGQAGRRKFPGEIRPAESGRLCFSFQMANGLVLEDGAGIGFLY